MSLDAITQTAGRLLRGIGSHAPRDIQADASPTPSPNPSPTPPPTTSPPPADSPAGPPAPTSSPKPGPAPLPPMSTDEEKAADQAARQALADDPAALERYEQMLGNDLFQRPDAGYPGEDNDPGPAARARISIMNQISHFPETRVIDNLDQMSQRGWFNDLSPEDKQRATRLVAYASSDATPGAAGNTTRRNTIDAMVRNDDPPLKFEDLQGDGGSGITTWGYRSSGGLLGGSSITLNRKTIAASDDPITDGSKDASVTLNTLAHEYNHELRDAGNNASFDYFMNEYRAWYAGHVSEHGHPPTQAEAFERARDLTMTDMYPNLRDVLDGKDHWFDGNDAGEEQAKLVAFMAQMSGLDPASATVDDIRQRSVKDVPAGEALAPRASAGDDPNIIDNHPR